MIIVIYLSMVLFSVVSACFMNLNRFLKKQLAYSSPHSVSNCLENAII